MNRNQLHQNSGGQFRLAILLPLALVILFCLSGCTSAEKPHSSTISSETGTVTAGKNVQPRGAISGTSKSPVASRKATHFGKATATSTNSIVLNGNIDPSTQALNTGAQGAASVASSGTFLDRLRNLPQALRENTPGARLTLAAIFAVLLAPAGLLLLVKIRRTKAIVESHLRA